MFSLLVLDLYYATLIHLEWSYDNAGSFEMLNFYALILKTAVKRYILFIDSGDNTE